MLCFWGSRNRAGNEKRQLPHHIFDKLVKASEFHGLSLEKYLMYRLVQTLETKVGAASVASPSAFSGVEAKKVTGPSNTGMVSRG